MSPSTHFRSFVYPRIYILHFSLSLSSSLLPSHRSRHTRVFSPSSRVRLECGRPVPIATALTSPLSQTFRHSLSPTHALILASVHSQGLSTITQSQILKFFKIFHTAPPLIFQILLFLRVAHTQSLSLSLCVCVLHSLSLSLSVCWVSGCLLLFSAALRSTACLFLLHTGSALSPAAPGRWLPSSDLSCSGRLAPLHLPSPLLQPPQI